MSSLLAGGSYASSEKPLAGAVFVAHNVHFDMRFVRGELGRAGLALPEMPFLCTMQLSRLVSPACPKRLGEVCEHFQIPLEQAHSAQADARAAAALLARCLDMSGFKAAPSWPAVGIHGNPVPADCWPKACPSGKQCPRCRPGQKPQSSYIAALVDKLPVGSPLQPDLAPYVAILEQVLLDRRVEESEAGRLLQLATEMGLSRQQAQEAHLAYLRGLLVQALEDGVVTDLEKRDITQVQHLLGLSDLNLDVEMQACRTATPVAVAAAGAPDLTGKTICFTGALTGEIDGQPIARSFAHSTAQLRGMIIKEAVTKSLDYLVTADPDSMSTKARKARENGTTILAEAVFWQMMGVQVG